MRPTFRKLQVKDIGELERLVAENVEGIEPGLKVIDSRLLLGQAAVDLVGLDSKGALVLIALDFTADEGLLLRVMDAYSWCLEYPDTIRRLYPMAQVAQNRPPRILFIVERLTDSFVRRIKQLSFLEIDCLEFRHLEVNGASALYFDLVQRLRRADVMSGGPMEHESRVIQAPPAPQAAVPRPASRLIPAPVVVPASPAPVQAAPVVAPAPAPSIEPIQPLTAAAPAIQPDLPVAARAETPEAVAPASDLVPAPAEPEPAPVAEPVASLAARTAALLAEATIRMVEAPEAAPPAPIVEESVADRAEEPEIRLESAGEVARQAEAVTPLVDVAGNPEWQALLYDLGVEMPKPKGVEVAESEAAAVAHEQAEAVMVVEGSETPVPAPAPVVEPTPASVQPPAWAKPADKPVVAPAAGRTYFFAQAVKGTTPADAPAPAPVATPTPAPAPAPAPTPAAVAAPAAAPAAQPAPAAPTPEQPKAVPAPSEARPELESLNFPKDGLSRQWLEFLNQLSAAK